MTPIEETGEWYVSHYVPQAFVVVADTGQDIALVYHDPDQHQVDGREVAALLKHARDLRKWARAMVIDPNNQVARTMLDRVLRDIQERQGVGE